MKAHTALSVESTGKDGIANRNNRDTIQLMDVHAPPALASMW